MFSRYMTYMNSQFGGNYLVRGADVMLAVGWMRERGRFVHLPVSGAFCDTSVNASDGSGNAGGIARAETLKHVCLFVQNRSKIRTTKYYVCCLYDICFS